MKEKILKYIFYSSALILLIIMLKASLSAGISCDEILHYNHSVDVYNYFATGGADKSALTNHPELNLKYYGQSYDNFVTFVTKWLNIEDIYTFRNLMSSLAGWLTIFVTALFAIWLKDQFTGIVVLMLFAISPAFIGHSYNNLKDIPFSLGYIAGIFLMLKFIFKDGKTSVKNAVLLTLSIAFCISIRAGGLLLVCYFCFFVIIDFFMKYLGEGRINTRDVIHKLVWVSGICLVAVLLSIVLWPYALQDPFRNILESYKIMAHYPATFRQIFEGKTEWSDFMPWYYLPKSMGITIPVLVLSGLFIFFLFLKKAFAGGKHLLYGFLVFTVIFPVIFVILEKSNLYSSWRQFLFLYPGIVIIASIGIVFLIDHIRNLYLKVIVGCILALMAVNPLRFMLKNHPYEYLYYNELAGGLKGAYGNYETDYYFTSQTEASQWLINYFRENNISGRMKVAATYTVSWDFRNMPGIETSWIRFEERSMQDWDYAIIVNRYIPPAILKKGLWPPADALHVIYADSVPICAVLERKTINDLLGYQSLVEGKYEDAIDYLRKALKVNTDDEMIFYNLAGALYKNGQHEEADSVLKKGLGVNAQSDLILMYLGNIAKAEGKNDEAEKYYEEVIGANRKFFDAYVELSKLVTVNDLERARKLLQDCMKLNPRYKPAINALGDTYLKTDPAIAEKYYEQAKKY